MNQSVKTKGAAYLQLMRFPNLFTAVADVLAGFLIAISPHVAWADLVGLIVSSSALYAGGCVLNDLCDWELDAVERPFRPLPSGRVSLWEAVFLLVLLFSVGLLASYLVGGVSFLLGVILVSLIVSYDVLTKDGAVIGPLNMAACRSCNLLLGMSCGLSAIGIGALFPFLTLGYVYSLTTLSRFEVNKALGSQRWTVLGGWAGVIGGILVLGFSGCLLPGSFVSVGILALFTGPALIAALHQPIPAKIGTAVKFLILGLPLLDAVYVSGTQGLFQGVVVGVCVVPAVLASRYLYVT